MINWIHVDVSADKSVLIDLKERLDGKIYVDEPLEITTDGTSSHLFISSMAVGEIMDEIQSISKEAEETIHIRYCASIPGSYHEITGTCKDGQMVIESDTTERVEEQED